MAAINSILNTQERAELVDGRKLNEQQEGDAFEFCRINARQKVA